MREGVTASDLMWMNVGMWEGLHEQHATATWNLGTVMTFA